MIPYGRQSVSEGDIKAVVDVLRSDFITQGDVVPAFERAVCSFTGAQYGVAVNSGTAALHVACLALGLVEGDWLWASSVSFVATSNCGLYCGANVDFIDIDPQTWNVSIESLEKKLVIAACEHRLPKVVVVVHLCGSPCDMVEISVLAKRYGFKVIEDACHALGGRYQGRAIGACEYGDITVFSFHPVKPITTGEGGMAMTNDIALAEKMKLLRSHGVTRDSDLMQAPPDGAWYYEQIALGYNYRLTDIQAALGLSQLLRLDEFVSKRRQVVARYESELSDLPVSFQKILDECDSGLHLFVIRVDEHIHRDIFEQFRVRGVGVNLHYMPIYRQPYYQVLGVEYDDFTEADQYYAEAISLPLFPNLTTKQQGKVINVCHELLG
jgi:UDP-4-amino-4,6-dideoxy-N-acetyl-beta-L-altrosamine transaminase